MHTNHNRRMELNRLAWKHCRATGMSYAESVALVGEVESGKTILDPVAVQEEVDRLISTLRLHEHCKEWVRTNGYAPYHGYADPNYFPKEKCECCARPLVCGTSSAGEHKYRELSPSECRALNVYHGGNCYHVSKCDTCGDVYAVDSSG